MTEMIFKETTKREGSETTRWLDLKEKFNS